MKVTSLLLSLAGVLLAVPHALAASAPPSRPCSDPCFQAAKAEFRDCTSSARFLDAVDGCVERARTCVDACRTRRQDCRDGTGVGAELLACELERDAAKDRCRTRFPLGSRLREVCLSKADIRHFRCRKTVRRSFRRALRDCRQTFVQCAVACAPGQPAEAPDCAKRREGRARAALASCKLTFEVTARACSTRTSRASRMRRRPRGVRRPDASHARRRVRRLCYAGIHGAGRMSGGKPGRRCGPGQTASPRRRRALPPAAAPRSRRPLHPRPAWAVRGLRAGLSGGVANGETR
jgi:hypothetical protein